jgi:hypothetical protein
MLKFLTKAGFYYFLIIHYDNDGRLGPPGQDSLKMSVEPYSLI